MVETNTSCICARNTVRSYPKYGILHWMINMHIAVPFSGIISKQAKECTALPYRSEPHASRRLSQCRFQKLGLWQLRYRHYRQPNLLNFGVLDTACWPHMCAAACLPVCVSLWDLKGNAYALESLHNSLIWYPNHFSSGTEILCHISDQC